MKVKITQPGWEKYNGDLGTVPFKDGVSINGISPNEARSLGAFVHVIEIDDDGKELGQINPALEALKMTSVSANLHNKTRTLKEIQEEEALMASEAGETPARTGPYTREELEAIAAEKGIAGVREIATPLGVKGTAINTLIAEILLRQTPAE